MNVKTRALLFAAILLASQFLSAGPVQCKNLFYSADLAFLKKLQGRDQLEGHFRSAYGVKEGRTVYEHTEQALKLFHNLLLKQDISKISAPEKVQLHRTLIIAMSLHDIGLPSAVQAGKPELQHEYTLHILTDMMRSSGFSDAEVKIARALVGNDILGQLVRGGINAETARLELQKLSTQSRLSEADFFTLQTLFYIADASSYPIMKEKYFYSDINEHLRIRSTEFARLYSAVHQAGPQVWDSRSLSDPNSHSPYQFSYLIHGLPNFDVIPSDLAIGRSKPIVFSSLVSEAKINSFGDAGVILQFSPEHVYTVSNEDTGSGFFTHVQDKTRITREQIFQALEGHKIASGPLQNPSRKSPHSILGRTKADNNNEIVLAGMSRAGDLIKVTGVFVKVDEHGVPLNPLLFLKAKSFSTTHQIPLVELRVPFTTIPAYTPTKAIWNKALGLTGLTFDLQRGHFEIDFSRLNSADFVNYTWLDSRKNQKLTTGSFAPKEMIKEIQGLMKEDPQLKGQLIHYGQELQKLGDNGSASAKIFFSDLFEP